MVGWWRKGKVIWRRTSLPDVACWVLPFPVYGHTGESKMAVSKGDRGREGSDEERGSHSLQIGFWTVEARFQHQAIYLRVYDPGTIDVAQSFFSIRN